MFIIIVYYIIFAVTFIYGLYFLVTGAIGIIRKTRIKYNNSKNYNNFAILIAARNEEKVIGNLIESLNRLNYPKDNYNIYVIIIQRIIITYMLYLIIVLIALSL